MKWHIAIVKFYAARGKHFLVRAESEEAAYKKLIEARPEFARSTIEVNEFTEKEDVIELPEKRYT